MWKGIGKLLDVNVKKFLLQKEGGKAQTSSEIWSEYIKSEVIKKSGYIKALFRDFAISLGLTRVCASLAFYI